MNVRHSVPHGCWTSMRLDKWIVAVVACVAFLLVPLAAQGNDFSLSYGPGPVPAMVVPSIFLLGTALVLLQWVGGRLPVRLFAVGLAVLAGIINIPAALRMTSAASWTFLLMSVVVLVLAAPFRPGWRLVSLVVSALLGLMHGINLLGQETGIPLLPEEGMSTSVWTSWVLLLLNMGLVVACGSRAWIGRIFRVGIGGESDETPLSERRRYVRTILVIAAVVLGGTVAGQAYLRLHLEQKHAELEKELAVNADLKVAQILAWWEERVGDANVLMQEPFLPDSLRAASKGAEAARTRAKLEAFFGKYVRIYGYSSLVLYDRTFTPLMAVPAGTEHFRKLSPEQERELEAAHDVLVRDLRRDDQGNAGMHLLVPIRSAGGTLEGTILLCVDARMGLFPILDRGGLAGKSAETQLVCRDGESVVFLNDQKFRPNNGRNLSFPLDEPGLAAARAVTERHVELSDGVDYRGVPVLWLARPVGTHPWVLVAKLDREEAYKPVRSEVWLVAGFIATGLSLVLLLYSNHLRNRQRHYELIRQETEREHRQASERLAVVMRRANDVILLFDENRRIVDANDRALEVYGHTPGEMRRLSAQDLRAADNTNSVEGDFEGVLTGDAVTFETVHRHRDGSQFPVEVSSSPVQIDGRRHVISIIRDITQRRAHEDEIIRINRIYRILSGVNKLLVRVKTREELFTEVCRLLVEVGKFQIAWIGWLNRWTHLLEAAAIAGDTHDYIGSIRISTDPDLPEARGPSGTAFREGRTYVCNDFFADPGTLPWRERAARSGFQSTIAIPLRSEGEIMGLLTVYATEKNFFDPAIIDLLEETAGDISFSLGVFAGEDRRRETEIALQAREEIFSSIVSQAMDAIVLVDAETGRFLEFNTAAHEGLGYTREEFTGLGIQDIQAQHSVDDIRRNIGQILAEGGMTFESIHRRRDGQPRDVRVSARQLRLQSRDCIAAIWSDITEAKRSALAQENQRRFVSDLIEYNSLQIYVKDREGRYQLVNRAFEEISDRRGDDVIGRTDAEVFPGPDGARFRANDLAVMAAGVGQTHEEVLNDGSGGERTFISNKFPVRDAEGEITGICGVTLEITGRKKMENELRKLSVAVEQSPASIVITDPTGAIEYTNPRFTEISGYTAEEVLGHNPRVLKSGLTPPEVYEDLWKTISQGGVWRGEIINRRKDGGIFTEMVMVTPVRDAEGTMTHYMAVKEDISERIRAQHAVEESEARFKRLLSLVPLPMGHVDETGRVTFLNERFRQVFGYTREDLPTIADWWKWAYPDPVYRAEIESKWSRALRAASTGDGLIEYVESRPTCKNGSVRNVEISGMTIGRECLAIFVDTTERMKAEKKLRQLSRTVEQAPLSIVITDLAGDIEYVNPAFLDVTGYSHEEVLGKNPRVLKSGMTPDKTYEDMWETLTQRRVWRGELNNKKKNGEIYTERAVIAPVIDESGEVTHYVALKEDITQMKAAEVALRESEARFRELFDLESDAILVVDSESDRIVQANEAAAKVYGYSVAEMTSLCAVDLSAEKEETRRLLQSVRENIGEVKRVPFRLHRRKDGTVLPVEVSVRTFLRGGRTMFVAVIRDITEQTKAREQLQRFNAELEEKVVLRTEEIASRNREIEALLQSIPDLVMRFGRDGTVINFQPAKEDTPFAGIDGKVGERPEDFIPAKLLGAAREAGALAIAGGGTATAEVEIELGPDPLTVELRAAPVGREEFVVFARNITARKRFEVEMAAMLDKEREVSEMKTRFISVTSHEFRTPMAAAMVSAEMLSNHFDRIAPPKRGEMLGRIMASLQRMTEMLEDVLTIGRMDAGRTKVELAPVDLESFLRAVIEEVKLGDGDAHRFSLRSDGGLGAFQSDRKVLHHILSNLLSNAVRYSPAGTKVAVSVTALDGGVRISVEDQGIGIPEKDLKRIFEPFERGSNVGHIKGTGLGLNIVQRMCGLLGGSVEAASVATGGTRFTLNLPRPDSHL